MPRLNDLNNDESVTGLFFGPSGTGKTVLLGSAGDRSLIIVPSNGSVSLKSKWFKEKYKMNPFVEIVDEDPLPEKAEGFDKVAEILESYFTNHLDDFDTFCVDDMTNLRRMAMNKGFEVNLKLKRSKSKEKYIMDHDIILKEMADFVIEMGFIQQFMEHWTKIAKQYKKNFFVSAHERLEFTQEKKVDAATGEKKAIIGGDKILAKNRPGFTGQTFPSDVQGLFDLTWHTEQLGSGDRTFYQLRTQGGSILECKTRWAGIFPTVIEQAPSLESIIKCIKTETPYINKR